LQMFDEFGLRAQKSFSALSRSAEERIAQESGIIRFLVLRENRNSSR